MMKDWKIKQELYHRLNVVHEDDLSKVNIEKTENVVEDALRYFEERDVGWLYPSKSYVVAICYAWWLSHDFKEDFVAMKQQLSSMDVTIPTLYKQYADLCDVGGIRFIDFNIDAKFAYCIDGLVMVDLHQLKPVKRKRYLGT